MQPCEVEGIGSA